MPDSALDVVVIGAGHAGLGISYHLMNHGLRHLVLERGRIGETWRAQRWNSFRLNSPNKFNALPGDIYDGPNPDGFCNASDFVSYLGDYAARFQLPVHERTRVLSIKRDASTYRVTALGDEKTSTIACRQVVVASGGLNVPKIPAFAKAISPDVWQCHASDYRSPSELPDGAVLVVGSAQSGLQLAEDLIDAGRRVFVSSSAVGRVPRRYRGADIFEWLLKVGFFSVKTEDITDPREFDLKQPQISGVGPLGHTLSLQSLARRGAIVLGKVNGAMGDVINIQTNAAGNIRFGDQVSSRIKGLIEDFIRKNRLDVPPPEPDPADEPDLNATCASSATALDLGHQGIRSIIWATGFVGDFGFLQNLINGGNGGVVHRNGISSVPGLYFVGLPWLRMRKSGIINGIVEDAAFIAERVKQSEN